VAAAKKRQRNQKGSVSVNKRGGMLLLRWRHEGTQHQISTGLPDTLMNRHAARDKAIEIERDIALGLFDRTLAKYRRSQGEPIPTLKPSAIDLWAKFTTDRAQTGTSQQAIATRYNAIASNLERFGKNPEDTATAREFIDFLRSRQSALIANQNLSLMKGFGAWCQTKGHWAVNPFTDIRPLKRSNATNPKRLPFTIEETRLILSTAKTHPKYHGYHDFCMALLYLGLRPSEAIGLKWKHINWVKQTVTISESLSRSESGKADGYARQTKTTKTGQDRTLELRPTLFTMLQGRYGIGQSPDALIFTSLEGKAIDDSKFCKGPWKAILKDAGISYRVPYAARHSLGSHLIESGASIPQAAEVLGNTPETMARYYSHAINSPPMPDF
jgi:integrase